MSKNEYSIIVEKKRILVTYDVYKGYHKEREHARYLKNKARICEIPLEWLETKGVHPPYQGATPSPLDAIIHQEQMDKLGSALRALSKDELQLIWALFFDGKSERQISEMLGISQKGVNKRKAKILAKLKKMMEI